MGTRRVLACWLGATLLQPLAHAAPGALDASFGFGGVALTPFGREVQALVRQPDGKLVAVGDDAPAFRDFALARYEVDGTLDPAFGSGGMVTTDVAGGDDTGYTALLEPDGRIVVVGQARVGGSWRFALARYDTDPGPAPGPACKASAAGDRVKCSR